LQPPLFGPEFIVIEQTEVGVKPAINGKFRRAGVQGF
jgi:hypothetical protein